MTITSAYSAPLKRESDTRSWGPLTFFCLALLSAVVMVFVSWQPHREPWFPERIQELLGLPTTGHAPLAVTDLEPVDNSPELVPDRAPRTSTNRLQVSERGYVWPAVGRITQEFGCTDFELEPWNAALGCRFHYGIDISGLSGTPVLAAKAGEVDFAGWLEDGYGYRVVLIDSAGGKTLYAHLCCPPDLSVGQSIEQGEQIGKIGTTGASSGNHLHFAIEVNGAALNPRVYLPPELSSE